MPGLMVNPKKSINSLCHYQLQAPEIQYKPPPTQGRSHKNFKQIDEVFPSRGSPRTSYLPAPTQSSTFFRFSHSHFILCHTEKPLAKFSQKIDYFVYFTCPFFCRSRFSIDYRMLKRKTI